jgi:hypothetical protein
MQTKLSPSLEVLRKAPCLIVTDADDQQSLFALTEGNSILAGSGDSCSIQLPCKEVNLLHCMFQLTNGRLWAQDWNTDGKTLFNGAPLQGTTVVSEHDELLIGGYRISACLLNTKQPTKDEVQAQEQTMELPETLPVKEAPCGPAEPAVEHFCNSSEQWDFQFDQLEENLHAQESSDAEPSHESLNQPANSTNTNKDEELEILRNEVVSLQIELGEKDAQLLQLCEANQFSNQCDENPVDKSQTERLVTRLEQLLAELEGSDAKVVALENQLQASEELNQAEREERHQLEAWVNQIEQRVLNREAERAAESESLQRNLQQERQQRKQAESQLKDAVQISKEGSSDQAARNMIDVLRKQNVELETRLRDAMRQLESRPEITEQSSTAVDADLLQELQNRVQGLESELASERAETARKKEQLTRFQNDMEKRLNEVKKTAENDSRIEALKQHFRELHQEEKLEQQERFERSLGGRIAKLWQKLDGR